MKNIKKNNVPHDYETWCNQVRGTTTEDYRCLQNPQKTTLQLALIEEQGWLCAYTMRRIDKDTSHIEHIKPESICRLEQVGADLDYDNLLACFPRDGMPKQYRYGAQRKDDWWENNGQDFVSPLHADCEAHFCFDIDGNISAAHDHTGALKTIQVLKLDHPSITEDRMRVIREFIYGSEGDRPLSKSEADQAIARICNRAGMGRFYEFCVAIRDALGDYKRQLEKIVNRARLGGTT